MKSILNSIALRTKKWLIFLIILPLLTGGASYLMEKRTPQTYTAQTTIELGNFENTGLTDPKTVAKRLNSTDFLEQMNSKSNYKFNVDEVKAKLNVATSDTKFIQLQYNDTSGKKAKDTLDGIVTSFIKVSTENYQNRYDLTQERLNDLIKITSNVESVNQQKEMYELGQTLNDYRNTIMQEPVKVSGSYVNPVKRGIFGLILGIMLDIIILVFPEIFKEYR